MMEVKCVNLPGRPTYETYICVQEVDGYKRVIPLYKLVDPDRLARLDYLFRECRIKGDEWLEVLGVSEEEILEAYFSTPEGKAEKLFRHLLNLGVIPRPRDGIIRIESAGKLYEIDTETLRIFVNGKEGCFQCKEDLPHFDKLIALCLTVIHHPERLERR